MISRAEGTVVSIKEQSGGLTQATVEVAGKNYSAINFDAMTGRISTGDRVLLNTTAVELNLGTGGNHFIMANLTAPGETGGESQVSQPGHIMKLRYTPNQVRVLAAEEQDSPYHELMAGSSSINSTPVICCSLHSMLPPAAAAVKAFNENLRVVYLMTDGAALPLGLSRMVQALKKEGLIQGTVTAGHAFGGDLETVNIYSGLLAAYQVLKADVVVAAMGPGIVGTGTPFGFSGIEQANLIHAVHTLEGMAIAVPRLGFADARERHRGLSHHSQTTLGKAVLVPVNISLPLMQEDKQNFIFRQMRDCGIIPKHKIILEDGRPGVEMLRCRGIKVTTMGRTPDQEPEFFLAASCAGTIAAKMSAGEELQFWEEKKL